MKKIIISIILVALIAFGFYAFLGGDIQNTETVNLFYYNPELDMDESGNILCSAEALVPVEREIEDNEDIIGETMRMLIKGDLTEEEINQGIETEFPLEDFTFESYSLEDGVLTLRFNDPNFSSSGGSCKVGILAGQIRSTAEQFSDVEEVRVLPADILQP